MLTNTILVTATVALLDAVVAEKVQNSECFFALDVSNEVKTRGIKAASPTGYGRHTDMHSHIFDRMSKFMATGAYACTDFPYNHALDIPSRRLYHPINTPQATIDAHANRKVIALPPVEVLMAQKSQQATGTQQAPKTDYSLPGGNAVQHDAARVIAKSPAIAAPYGTQPSTTLGDVLKDAGHALHTRPAADVALDAKARAEPPTLGGHILRRLGTGAN